MGEYLLNISSLEIKFMSKKDEQEISRLIENNLGFRFKNRKYILDDWGQVDNWCEIIKDTFVFLEVETSQQHPNTNVLKVWPYLSSHKNVRIFLIQTYFTHSPGINSSRGRLSEWLGNELQEIMTNRFNYCRIIVDKNIDWNLIKDELKIFENKANIPNAKT